MIEVSVMKGFRRPSSITRSLSEISRALEMSCSTRTIAAPLDETYCITAFTTLSDVSSSNSLRNSSANISLGRCARVLAIATRLCCPPESLLIGSFLFSSKPIARIAFVDCSLECDFVFPALEPSITLAQTLECLTSPSF